MKRLFAKGMAAGFCLLAFVFIASSKVPLSKLSVSGGQLSRPIEANHPQLMQSSNPWFGSFISPGNQIGIGNPPTDTTRYKITFYATFQHGQPPHPVYVVYYTFDASTREGFVYLPGPRDWEYRTNEGTIIRSNQDGHWNVADAGWCEQINEIIAHSDVR